MQTFLPLPGFHDTAAVLDYRRLGKQRVEAWQILRNLRGESSRGWSNHPAVKMWAGYEGALADYGVAICQAWIARGYRDTLLDRFFTVLYEYDYPGGWQRPLWLGDPAFHASHRSNLLRKDPVWYGQFGWTEHPDDPYVWPVSHAGSLPAPAQAGIIINAVNESAILV